MAWFVHEGRPLHYLVRGRGEPVLLVHGWGSSGADWALQVAALEQDFRVIVPDLPGSGHSARSPAAGGIDGMARALWALCDHLHASRINLVGFSLGGAVSLEMALQRPGGVRRLALINSLPSYRLDTWSKWAETALTVTLVPLLGMRRAAGLAARRLFPMPWQQSLRERAAAAVGGVPLLDYLLTGRALIRWSARDRLDRLEAKALLIAAERDFTPLEEKRLFARTLGAPLLVVRDSRHGTPFDAVQLTNTALRAFLVDGALPAAHLCLRDARAQPISFPGSLAEEHAASRAAMTQRAPAGVARRRRAGLAPARPLAGRLRSLN